ncbi:MAG: polyphosphate polymerase domain-containing protein [Enterococcus sp.]|nr:polyphosphate polymerase domain-containing protein [Enterococcus sp.]
MTKSYQQKFYRIEKKYLITERQRQGFIDAIGDRLIEDKFTDFTIKNVYLDTKDFLLIRRSIEKPTYKEKFRIRAYKDIRAGDSVFLETKKKYKGVVGKRRVILPYDTALEFTKKGSFLGLKEDDKNKADAQILKEFEYSYSYYGELSPMIYLEYYRRAFVYGDDKKIRITFDSDIKYSFEKASLIDPPKCQNLADGFYIMEIKSEIGLPRELLKALGDLDIKPCSFSKVGKAYKNYIANQRKDL